MLLHCSIKFAMALCDHSTLAVAATATDILPVRSQARHWPPVRRKPASPDHILVQPWGAQNAKKWGGYRTRETEYRLLRPKKSLVYTGLNSTKQLALKQVSRCSTERPVFHSINDTNMRFFFVMYFPVKINGFTFYNFIYHRKIISVFVAT